MLAGAGFLAGLCSVGSLAAFTAKPSRADPTWSFAELHGGDIRAVIFDPSDPDRVLAGTSAGQIFLSQNSGDTWSSAGEEIPFPGWVVSDLHFDLNQENRLWASFWGIFGGGLIAYSDDLGEHWTALNNGLQETQVYTLTTVAGKPETLYAGTRQGVYGVESLGQSWRRLTADHPEIEKVTSLLVDPDETGTIYAGTWQRAYRSEDSGRTWQGVFQGMVLDSEVFTLSAVPGQPGELWASTCGWVYRGVDRGARWTRHRQGFEQRRTPSFLVLRSGRLLAGTVGGVHLSDDNGLSWERRSPATLVALDMAQHPRRPERIVVASEGAGVWFSEDGGESFQPRNRGLTNLRISALARRGDTILAAVRHAGPLSGLYQSRDGGHTFTTHSAELPTILDFAVTKTATYIATEKGLFELSGTETRQVAELKTLRVDQVSSSGERIVARAGGRLYEQRDGRFTPLPDAFGTPKHFVLDGEYILVGNGDSIKRLGSVSLEEIPIPQRGSTLLRLGSSLVLAGSQGAWATTDPLAGWLQLSDGPIAALSTGDSEYPALLVSESQATLMSQDGELHSFPLPVPARDVESALLDNGKLLLGTSGYGLLIGRLPGLRTAGQPHLAGVVAERAERHIE